jgi:acid phosphatase type 7
MSQRHLFQIVLFAASCAFAQTAATLPTNQLISQPGAAFRIADSDLSSPTKIIAYGDVRFTDPANIRSTNPKVRRWLVAKIASEKPTVVVINGDLPLAGDVINDYAVYKSETQIWRDNHIRVLPTLGNHEFHGDAKQSLENWWNAFPEMRDRRWYAAQIGARIYVMAVDSDTSLLPGSDQDRWIRQQLSGLPSTVDFLLVTMHHPPVADIQTHITVDHNPRPNEIALRDLLSEMAPRMHARIIVSAGHIHNYERNVVDEVVYLVSGGGGATPYYVERTKDDAYQSLMFPNYHYVRFTLLPDRLHAEMIRVLDPDADEPAYQVKDRFDISVKR